MQTTITNSQLKEILSLPIKLTSVDIPLFDLPFFKLASKENENVFVHQVKFGESIRQFVDRVDAHYLDCSMFVQLVGQFVKYNRLSSDSDSNSTQTQEDKKSQALFFCVARDVGLIILSTSGYSNVGYIRPKDQESHENLQKLPVINKGQWAIQIGEDQYLGLSENGPIVLSFDEWVQLLLKNLQTEEGFKPKMNFSSMIPLMRSSSMRSSSSFDDMFLDTLKCLINCKLKMGCMNEWIWEPLMSPLDMFRPPRRGGFTKEEWSDSYLDGGSDVINQEPILPDNNPKEEDGISIEGIELVLSQTAASRDDVKATLRKYNGDIVNSIMALTA